MSSPSPFCAAFHNRCPHCGEGTLYDGLLKVRDTCGHCGLDLRNQDAGDGPAFFVITIMGALIVALPALVEWTIGLPGWLHALIWIPFLFAGSLILLRFFKSYLIALQYKHHRLEETYDGPFEQSKDSQEQ